MPVSKKFKDSLKDLSQKEIRCLLIIAKNFNGTSFTWEQVRTKYMEEYGDILEREDFEKDLLDNELIIN